MLLFIASRASVVDGPLTCNECEVVVCWSDFDTFVEHLRLCELGRTGEAKLSGMQFELSIATYDSWGHFKLQYEVGMYDYAVICASKSIRGEFALDSEYMARLCIDFESLSSHVRAVRDGK